MRRDGPWHRGNGQDQQHRRGERDQAGALHAELDPFVDSNSTAVLPDVIVEGADDKSDGSADLPAVSTLSKHPKSWPGLVHDPTHRTTHTSPRSTSSPVAQARAPVIGTTAAVLPFGCCSAIVSE